ncbi:MAG: tetratricopeptide repeat-containing sensor histidine kinase [Cyclobacteriaceae bacterium]|nr:tetratricopeptide repeat-containing sensor histidine kinase [Cyclobacteriaceae bacterium]
MVRLALLVLLLSPLVGISQSPDSLLSLARKAKMDSSKVRLLNKAAIALRETDSNLALRYAEEARNLADSLNDQRTLGEVLTNIGWIFYRKGIYSQALERTTHAMAINKALNNKSEIAACLNTIGAIQFEQNEYGEAIASFKEAYTLARSVNHRVNMSRSLNNIAFSFLRLRKFDSARYYVNRSVTEHVSDKFRLAFSDRILGDIFFEEGKYTDALKSYDICLASAIDQNNNFLKSSTLFRIGKTYLKLRDSNKALKVLNENLFLTKRFGFKGEQETTLQLMSEAFAMRNDFSNAYEFQGRYLALHDSLSDQRGGEQINLLEAQYNLNLKNAQIDLLTKDTEYKEQEINTQRVGIYIGIVWLACMLLFIIILFRTNRRARAANRLLKEKNELIEQQAHQLIGLNATKDKLLSIIGHDLRGPLNSLRGMMDLLNKSFISQEEFIEFSKKIKTNVDFVYTDLENLLSWAQAQQKGLKTVSEKVSLRKAIQNKVNLLQESILSKKLNVTVEIEETIQVVADKNQLDLILRNLISNAIKFSYSGGSIVIGSIEEPDNTIRIFIKDTGTGMESADLDRLLNTNLHFTKPGTSNEKGMGLGLLLVKEFVQLNKGTLAIESKPGTGSTFSFTLLAG